MADPEIHAILELLRDAMRAPPEVTELTSESGRRVQIERHPEPGVELLVREDTTSGPDSALVVLTVIGATTRPARYPPSIPFVPGADATVVVLADRTTVTWAPSGLTEDGAAVSDAVEALEAFRDDLAPLAERMRDVDSTDPTVKAEVARAAADSLSPSVRERLRAAWEKYATPGADALQQLERTFDAVVRSTEGDGWSRGETKEANVPFHLRSVEYSQGDWVRAISMNALAGPGSMVMLMQHRRGAM